MSESALYFVPVTGSILYLSFAVAGGAIPATPESTSDPMTIARSALVRKHSVNMAFSLLL
jgi:hypothetical protein